MTSAQVVETSGTTNSSFQNCPSPGRPHNTNYWYSWVQTIYYVTILCSAFPLISVVAMVFSCWLPWAWVLEGNRSISGKSTAYPNLMHLSCDEGFVLNGLSKMQCQANQTWSKSSSWEICSLIVSLNVSFRSTKRRSTHFGMMNQVQTNLVLGQD